MDAAQLIARVRTRLRRTVLLGGTARLVGILVLAVGLAVLADRIWLLPGWFRLVLLAGIVGGLGLVAWRRLLRPLRTPLSDRDLAAFIERRTPGLDGRLISAVEGIALGEAERERLAAAVPPGCERRLVPASRLPRYLLGGGAALAAALLVGLAAPWFWRDGLARLALPLSDRDWERRTALAIEAERAVVALDEPAVVTVARSRGPDGVARIAWRDEAGRGGARQLPGASGPWRQALTLGPGRWTVTASGGDAHPVASGILVVERPRLDRAAATLTPPGYSGLPAQELPAPACQALPGSRLALRLAIGGPAGRPAQRVSARLGESAIALSPAGDGTWSGETVITTSAELVIEAADADGIALNPPARFAVTADPDRAPAVSLGGPRGDEAVGPRAVVEVAVDAGDDYGLGRIGLEATVSGANAAPGQPQPLLDLAVDGRRALTRRVPVEIGRLAGPGAAITLVGSAADRNDVSGPGLGRSAPLIIKVVAEDELRRDLERQLGEARDRVAQARTALAPGLAEAAKLPAAARSAAQDAARATELLARIERRWRENALEAERIAPAGEAREATAAAGPELAKASGGDDPAARAGEAALERAERALDRMLSDSDLTRIIAQLIERQTALATETRAFVREHLTRQPDEAGRARQSGLAERQRELSARTAEAERRILAGPTTLDPAKAQVRDHAPAERMGAAAGAVASSDRRTDAAGAQEAALTGLRAILEALRGGDRLADLGRRAGELAERQARLAEAIERGMPRDEAAREQQRLKAETDRLAEDMARSPQGMSAAQSAAAAANAQGAAGKQLGAGDRAGAARDAGTAAELLRQAQRDLDPRARDPEGKDQPQQPDIIALLRRLLREQAKVLADSLPVDKRIGEDEPDFAAKRDLAAIADLQEEIRLRLGEDGIKLLDRQPIALAALTRADAAMARVLEHLRRPALGARGLALERIALAELKRIIDVAGSLPQGPSQGGGQGGGQGGSQAPFPPAAEIGLLIATQDEAHQRAAAGRPADAAEAQAEVAKLVALVEGATRPGSRPQVLMGRARRAAEGAAQRLGERDAGAATRHHMVAAAESLRQLLAEAQGQGGGGGGSSSSGGQQGGGKPVAQGESPPPGGGGAEGAGQEQGQPQGKEPGQAQQGNGQASGTLAGAAGTPGGPVAIDQIATALLQLPPERREQLKQAREQRLPAGALQLFERYLEKLEEP